MTLVHPEVLVCLGATAAQVLLGRDFKVSQQHGQWIHSPLAKHVTSTFHPSAILRMPDEAARRAAQESLVDDLKEVAAIL